MSSDGAGGGEVRQWTPPILPVQDRRTPGEDGLPRCRGNRRGDGGLMEQISANPENSIGGAVEEIIVCHTSSGVK